MQMSLSPKALSKKSKVGSGRTAGKIRGREVNDRSTLKRLSIMVLNVNPGLLRSRE